MQRCEVLIVGAGPVGLLLACLLAQRSVSVRIIEAARERSVHSRAIGIHPPGLRCLAHAAVVDEFVARGVRVQRGRVYGPAGMLGSVSFARLAGDFPFVLSLPQSEGEAILERRLARLAPRALERGVRALGLLQEGDGCVVHSEDAQGLRHCFAQHVVACDGRHSALRQAAGIPFLGAPYRRRFLMGDTRDDTPFGDDAAVFLATDGLVESFPLPRGMRRWVVSLTTVDESAPLLAQTVERRTGQRIDLRTLSMLSAFTPEHYLAHHFVSGRLILAGDAAHVMSPIGGQGMNFGLLDSVALSGLLVEDCIAPNPQRFARAAQQYACERRRAASQGARRAACFMGVGTAGGQLWLRGLLRVALGPWLHDASAGAFAMGGF